MHANNLFGMQETILEVYLNLFTDFGFKKIFGVESNAAILINFLNTLLQPDKKIVAISYLNTERLGISDKAFA